MKILSFDTETTGVDPSSCRVCSFALMEYDYDTETEGAVFDQMCNPTIQIPAGASNVHGIYNHQVDHLAKDATALGALANYVLDAAQKTEVVLCGHNLLHYDLPILERLTGCGKLVERGVMLVDTLVLARRLLPLAPNHKLSDLIKHLGLGTGEGAHGALADVKMVYELLVYFAALTSKSMLELAHWCATPIVLEVCYFGKFKGWKFSRAFGDKCVPASFIDWAIKNMTDMPADLKLTIKEVYGR